MNSEIGNTEKERKYVLVWKRVFSHLIDSFMNGLIIFLIIFIIGVLIRIIITYNTGQNTVVAEPTGPEKIISIINIFIPMLAVIGGQTLSMIFMKKTIGMRLFNFKIVNEDGTDISMDTRIIRNVIWVLLVISGVGIAADFILLYISEKHQSVIDLIMKNIALHN